MSRHKAKESFNWKMVQPYLDERGVKLISAGLDEVPMVYKNIEEVMAAQTDLVEPLAKFFPRLVKMAPAASGRRIESGFGWHCNGALCVPKTTVIDRRYSEILPRRGGRL